VFVFCCSNSKKTSSAGCRYVEGVQRPREGKERVRRPSSKNPKKRARDGGNTARTYRYPSEMPVPPSSRAPINLDTPPTDDFNQLIHTTVAMSVATVQQSPLSVLGGDLRFARGVNFNLPPNTEDMIRAVPEDDLLKGSIEMMCRGFILTRHGATARRRLRA